MAVYGVLVFVLCVWLFTGGCIDADWGLRLLLSKVPIEVDALPLGLDASAVAYSSAMLAVLGLSTLLMIVLNNSNAIIRIYSRMVSCSFIALSIMQLPLLWQSGRMMQCYVVQLCLIVFYLLTFSAYQDKHSQGKAFFAFLMLGIASVFFIQILFFVPFMWILMGRNMMAMNMRILIASLLGLLLPYWFAAGWCAYVGDMTLLTDYLKSIGDIFVPGSVQDVIEGIGFTRAVADIEAWRIITPEGMAARTLIVLVLTMVLAVIGMTHFLRFSYSDKIRTRMIYEMVITLMVITICFIILQPQHIIPFMALLTLNASLLIAHFIALTESRFSNVMFIVMLVAVVLLTALNMLGGRTEGYAPTIYGGTV